MELHWEWSAPAACAVLYLDHIRLLPYLGVVQRPTMQPAGRGEPERRAANQAAELG